MPRREREIKINESQDTFWALQRRRLGRRVRDHKFASAALLLGTIRLTTGGVLDTIDESFDYERGTGIEFAIGDSSEMTIEQKEESDFFGRIRYFGAVSMDIRDAEAGRDVDLFTPGTPTPQTEATPISVPTPTK